AVPFFRQLQVVGSDIRIPLFRKLSAQAEWARSTWDARDSGGGLVDLNAGFDRDALDVRLNIPFGSRGLFQPFWKDIGAGFDAPGSWGRMGRWWNYRGVERTGATR